MTNISFGFCALPYHDSSKTQVHRFWEVELKAAVGGTTGVIFFITGSNSWRHKCPRKLCLIQTPLKRRLYKTERNDLEFGLRTLKT